MSHELKHVPHVFCSECGDYTVYLFNDYIDESMDTANGPVFNFWATQREKDHHLLCVKCGTIAHTSKAATPTPVLTGIQDMRDAIDAHDEEKHGKAPEEEANKEETTTPREHPKVLFEIENDAPRKYDFIDAEVDVSAKNVTISARLKGTDKVFAQTHSLPDVIADKPLEGAIVAFVRQKLHLPDGDESEVTVLL